MAPATSDRSAPNEDRGRPSSDDRDVSAGASSEASSPIGVLIVDSSPILRPVLADIIGDEENMAVCGPAATAEEAFAVLAETNPHVAIVDISLKDAHGLDLVQNLQAQYPQMQAVIFSMCDERVYAAHAVRAGAAGYVMKAEPTERLIEAIRTVVGNEFYLSRRASSRLLGQLVRARSEGAPRERQLPFKVYGLTDREMEVLQLVGRAKTTTQIADQLGIKTRMANAHQRRIRRKLDLSTATELRQFAIQWMMASRHLDGGGAS